MSSPKTIKEIKFVILKFTKKKSPGSNGFTGEFFQTFIKVTPILHNVFDKTEEEGLFFNSFYEAGITLVPQTTNTVP